MERGHHGGMDAEAMRERMEFGVDRILSKLKATDAQKTQVKAIMETSLNEMLALREQHTLNRDAIVASLTGNVVDRDKLEAARKAEVALAERASLLMSRTAADVAEVLTPDQRRTFLDMMRRFGGPMGFAPGMPDQPRQGLGKV
jgi:Spy/CpxP family protein refolding chaperone